MFLSRLTSFARSPASVSQLSNLLQKCSLSSTSALLAKSPKIHIENAKPELTVQPEQDPVKLINTKIDKNELGRLFAVIQLCGKQFKVTTGDIILVEGYWEPRNGDKIQMNKVLVAGSQDFSLIGRPILQPGLVDIQATVIEKSLSHTRTHFKKKRRKQFMRINFQRQETTMLMINSIEFTGLLDEQASSDDLNEKMF